MRFVRHGLADKLRSSSRSKESFGVPNDGVPKECDAANAAPEMTASSCMREVNIVYDIKMFLNILTKVESNRAAIF
jgi:hypothetical protein